ncbi:MAG: glutamine synthetase family protein, partial [Paracoccaceae bacterium]
MTTTAIDVWFSDHPDLTNFRAGLFDLNGALRGKRLPVAQCGKVADGRLRMPLSVTSVDIWGSDIRNSPLVFASGDADGICRPTGRGPFRMNWLSEDSALVPVWMFNEDGTPFEADPRQVLARVLSRYSARGWRPVVGTELEFCLFGQRAGAPSAAISPLTYRDLTSDAILSVDELDHFDGFLDDVYAACRAFGIPADAAISECGPGQFEINLDHRDDALAAADDAALFKRLVRGVARNHGMAASFMAKPRLKQAGNGLHIHFSVLDGGGRNIFDDGTSAGSAALHSAVAGCLAAMQESTLVFAPHLNSYRRFEADSHAPTAVAWGYENRTAAIRIPGGAPAARRIEHRVAGADANPYLVLASLLGAALLGIEREMPPPDPVTGNTYGADLPRLPTYWHDAIRQFEGGSLVAEIFPSLLIDMFARCKRQEMD